MFLPFVNLIDAFNGQIVTFTAVKCPQTPFNGQKKPLIRFALAGV
jgi:hypothetical protein